MQRVAVRRARELAPTAGRRVSLLLAFGLVAAVAALVARPGAADAQPGWSIQSFAVDYNILPSGTVRVTEDIAVDFGSLQRHGIFRDMPVRYRYDDEHDRLIAVGDVSVDDGAGRAHRFELISSGANLRIKIGDPDVWVTGQQRYRISYSLLNALNPVPADEFGPERDEFFWNVTGNDWEATILAASATVTLPSPAVQAATCYEGPVGSREPCRFSAAGASASFEATDFLPPGSGLTVVVAIDKGAVEVGPPVLVPRQKTDWERFADAWSFSPLTIGVALIVGLIALVAIVRLWWAEGRDRWHGQMFHLMDDDGSSPGARKPLFAHETVVVEYQPPEVTRRGRRLRPAEIGVLIDERADTLEVTATIVDLAVRKYLKISEEKTGGIFGLFKKTDYRLDRLDGDGSPLLPFEERTLKGLFGSSSSVALSSLQKKFYKELQKIKDDLYRQSVADRFFPRSPESTRNLYRAVGVVVALTGAAVGAGLGIAFGGALIGVPVVLAGIFLLLFAGLMPRRTAQGRSLYRRCLGFKRFMLTAEKERQRFAENRNIFHEYLPYAIVFQCVERWAKVFEDLGLEPRDAYWYSGTTPARWALFASTINSLSSSVSTTIASTPGGSGRSGFGGGSGRGGGGGGGGSW